MLEYDLPLFRPPSEARSLLIQVTLGCSHNKCSFCSMYESKKYRERKLENILTDIDSLKKSYKEFGYFPPKAFLCDGDALNAPIELLLPVLNYIKINIPEIRRVGVYATAKNVLDKTDDELKQLKDAGLDICYIGLESGSDDVLDLITKGNTKEEIIIAGKKLKKNKIKISMIALLGVAGKQFTKIHAKETAEVVNIIGPEFFSFLTTTVVPNTAHDRMIKKGIIIPLTHKELLKEMLEILKGINSPSNKIIFRANHVSNDFPLSGILPRDNMKLMQCVQQWIAQCPDNTYPDMDFRNL